MKPCANQERKPPATCLMCQSTWRTLAPPVSSSNSSSALWKTKKRFLRKLPLPGIVSTKEPLASAKNAGRKSPRPGSLSCPSPATASSVPGKSNEVSEIHHLREPGVDQVG